jgi:hypothetical protein
VSTDEQPRVVRDHYDKIIGNIDGLPGVRKTKPSTVTSVTPFLGLTQTHVVQTYRDADGGDWLFIQMVDAEGRARLVLPPRVTAAILRQHEALTTRGRRERQRDRWADLSPEQRKEKVQHLRRPKAVSE